MRGAVKYMRSIQEIDRELERARQKMERSRKLDVILQDLKEQVGRRRQAEEEARAALVDKMAEGGYIPRAELEAALRPEYITFRTGGLNLTFPKGTLPSQEYTTGGSFDYAELDGLLQPWAIPVEPEQER